MRTLEDEREEYESFSQADRRFIAQALDHVRYGSVQRPTGSLVETAQYLAMQEVVRRAASMNDESKHHLVLQPAAVMVSPMIEIGIFAQQSGCLIEFGPVRFLMERVFDDAYVPHIASAYAAVCFSATHVSVPIIGLDDALIFHNEGRVKGNRQFVPTSRNGSSPQGRG